MLLTTDILYWKLTSFLCLVQLYAFAISNIQIYLRIGPKTRTDKPPIFENPPGRPYRGPKEDMSGETRNPDVW